MSRKFNPEQYKVKLIPNNRAIELIVKHHYTHKCPSIKYSFGMFYGHRLVGACTYGTTFKNNVKGICGDEYADNVLELTRLVLLDFVEHNAESWFISKTLTYLRQHTDTKILISYADSAFGHNGTIYQATNWIYSGKSVHNHYRLEDGTIVHSRSTYDHKKGETMQDFWDKHPNAISVKSKPKFRYVYLLGKNRQEKRELKSKYMWADLPYPKEREL